MLLQKQRDRYVTDKICTYFSFGWDERIPSHMRKTWHRLCRCCSLVLHFSSGWLDFTAWLFFLISNFLCHPLVLFTLFPGNKLCIKEILWACIKHTSFCPMWLQVTDFALYFGVLISLKSRQWKTIQWLFYCLHNSSFLETNLIDIYSLQERKKSHWNQQFSKGRFINTLVKFVFQFRLQCSEFGAKKIKSAHLHSRFTHFSLLQCFINRHNAIFHLILSSK